MRGAGAGAHAGEADAGEEAIADGAEAGGRGSTAESGAGVGGTALNTPLVAPRSPPVAAMAQTASLSFPIRLGATYSPVSAASSMRIRSPADLMP